MPSDTDPVEKVHHVLATAWDVDMGGVPLHGRQNTDKGAKVVYSPPNVGKPLHVPKLANRVSQPPKHIYDEYTSKHVV